MSYALVHFPDIDKEHINNYRKKYDPKHKLIDAHITIIFPVVIEETKLINHVARVLRKFKPFTIHINGVSKSTDQYLFLVLKEGKKEVIKLHDQLYKGILAMHLHSDIQFVPHITIGLFAKKMHDKAKKIPLDEKKYSKALAEAAKLHYECNVEKLTLVKINEKITKVKNIKVFYL